MQNVSVIGKMLKLKSFIFRKDSSNNNVFVSVNTKVKESISSSAERRQHHARVEEDSIGVHGILKSTAKP